MVDIPLMADIDGIRSRRQQRIDAALLRENKRRIDYNYSVGERIWLKEYDPTKMEPKLHGPYPITRIYVNGTVDVELRPGVTQRFNVRKVVPFRHALAATTGPLPSPAADGYLVLEVEAVHYNSLGVQAD